MKKHKAIPRGGGTHTTPRTPIQLPTHVADVGKQLARARGSTFVGLISDLIAEELGRPIKKKPRERSEKIGVGKILEKILPAKKKP